MLGEWHRKGRANRRHRGLSSTTISPLRKAEGFRTSSLHIRRRRRKISWIVILVLIGIALVGLLVIQDALFPGLATREVIVAR
jgi:hypothetical protein